MGHEETMRTEIANSRRLAANMSAKAELAAKEMDRDALMAMSKQFASSADAQQRELDAWRAAAESDDAGVEVEPALMVRPCFGNSGAAQADRDAAVSAALAVLAGRNPAKCKAEFSRQWDAIPHDENVPSYMTGDAKVWWDAGQAAQAVFIAASPRNFRGCFLVAA